MSILIKITLHTHYKIIIINKWMMKI
jgi:hypothetical protein